jgi:hypothetical protein
LCPAGTYGRDSGLSSSTCSGTCSLCPAGSSSTPCPTTWNNGLVDLNTFPSLSFSNCTGFVQNTTCSGGWMNPLTYTYTFNNFPCSGIAAPPSSCSFNGGYKTYDVGCGAYSSSSCCVCPPGTVDTGVSCSPCPANYFCQQGVAIPCPFGTHCLAYSSRPSSVPYTEPLPMCIGVSSNTNLSSQAQPYMVTPGGANFTTTLLGQYLSRSDCTLFLIAQSGFIMVNFSLASSEPGYDYLTIFDGPSSQNSTIVSLAGLPPSNLGSYTSSGSTLTIRFTSDHS